MASISNNKITFDSSDWLAGLHPRYNSGPTDTPLPKSENKLSYSLAFNPYRQFGMASPGFLPSSVTNASVVTNSAIRRIIQGAEVSTYYGYGINSNELVFQMSTAGTLTSSGTWPHAIASASGSEEGSDIINYSAKIGGTRAARIFYSYSSSAATNTDPQWNVGVYSLDGSTFDDDFMSSAPATPLVSTEAGGGAAFRPHPMIVGDDDVLYIGDGNLVHGYDGANIADNDGKFFASVLTLPAGFMITSFAKYQKSLAIFGFFQLTTPLINTTVAINSFNKTESRVFFWDYLSLDPYDSKTLNDNYVSGAFEYKGTIGCFTQGRKIVPLNPQYSKVMIYDGSEFQPMATFDTNVPFHGAYEILGDTISFVSQGNIYMYGSPYPDASESGLNRVGKGNGTANGGICTLSTTIQVASTGTTTSGGLDTVSSGVSAGFVTTAPAMPQFEDAQIGKVKKVKVYFAQTSAADGSLNIFLISDFGAQTQILSQTTAITAANQVQTITTALSSSSGSLPRFTSLGIVLQWGLGVGTAATIVDRIEVEYEPVTFNNS